MNNRSIGWVSMAWVMVVIGGWVGGSWGQVQPDAAGSVASSRLVGQASELKIEPVLWQILPQGVRMVYVGPDGRLWWELEGVVDGARWTVEQIKAGIEKEFAQKEPKVVGARPALFEKSGRVWFITQDGSTLLGYAGTLGQWLERQGASWGYMSGSYDGWAMTPGWSSPSGYNLEFDHKRFFVFGFQIVMYDGITWTQQTIEGAKLPVRLLAEPDGRGLLAITVGGDRPVWRYVPTAGWSPLTLPKGWTARTIVSVVPIGDGQAWVRTDRLGLRLVKLDGPNASMVIQEEVEAKGFKAAGIGSLWRTAEGDTFVSARDLLRGDQSAGAGVLQRKPDGSMEVIRGEPLYVQTAGGSDPYQAVVIRSGRSVLLPGRDGRGAAVVDLKDGRVESSPGLGHEVVVGYQGGEGGGLGKIFLARRGSEGKPGLPLAVWQPGQPDHRSTVRMERTDASATAWATATDGSLIMQSRENVIERLNGQTRQVVTDRLKGSQVQAMAVMGPAEILAAVGFRDWSLVFEDRVYTEPGIKELLAHYTSDFVAIFRGRSVACGDLNKHQVAVDKDGNIWLINGQGMLQVLVDGRWIDALAEFRLKAAAGGDAAGRQDQPVAIGLAGDGQFVYMQPKVKEVAGKWGVMGRVLEGQVQCLAVPGGGEISMYEGKPVRDAEGGLWVSQTEKLDSAGGIKTRWSAGVVDGQGQVTAQSTAGRAIFLDKAGYVWLLRQVTSDGLARVQVWKQGKITQELDVPAGEDACWVSDKAGSVWAWTAAGLHHYVAPSQDMNQPGAAGDYQLQRVLYPVDEQGAMPVPRRLGTATGGWLVLGHHPAGFRTTAAMYLVPTDPKK